MISESSVSVRIRRSEAVAGSGMEVLVRRADPDGDLGTWRSWDVVSIEIVLPDVGPEPLAADVLVDQVTHVLLEVLNPPGPSRDALLLAIEHPDLTGLPWEVMAVPLGRQVVRYSRRLAAYAYEPVDVPPSILFAGVEGDNDGRMAVGSRYFRTVQASKQTGGDIERLVAGGHFDIVHLGVRIAVLDPGRSESHVLYTDGSAVNSRTLKQALRRSRARLLVLEAQLDSTTASLASFDQLRRLAHRLHKSTGIAVLASDTADFRDFYFNLTHDLLLTDLVALVRPLISGGDQAPALWLRKAGDSTLRLMAAGARLAADVIQEHQRLEAAMQAQGIGGAQEVSGATLDAMVRLTRLRERTFYFDQESRGVEPMAESRAELQDVQQLRSRSVAEPTGRVINAWVQAEGGALPSATSLAKEKTYQLAVNIGRPDRRGVTLAPMPIDETVFAHDYDDGAAELTVVVSSNDFGVDQPVRSLRLPPPPDDSDRVLFTISSPLKPGSYRLRIGVYHRTNLLQSLIMTVAVTDDLQTQHRAGIRAELEWALSSTFRNLDEMEEPALTIVSNEGPQGSHTFVAYADGFGAAPVIHHQIDLPPDQLKATIDDARNDLQNVCATFKNGRLDKYRFSSDNRGSRSRLLDDLKVLALAGSGLFVELTTGGDASFNTDLEDRLRGGRLIQIASVKSANYVFPWSLVYDHDFRESAANVLCDVIGNVLDRGGNIADLQTTECFTDECPHRHDPKVVCPAGFWGFRHRIEQPLLTPPAIDAVDSRENATIGGTPRHDVITEIPLGGHLAPEIVIGVSESLSDWSPHINRLVSTFGGYPTPMSSIDPLLDGLRRLDLHLAYFYCHGGRQGSKAYLGMGSRREVERLFPQYLKSVRWPDRHPFVFINGCRTVGVSPDDLLSFNKMFARAEASGLLGTEIAVPEELAQHVALKFFELFWQRLPIGEVTQQVRLELLTRYNPLGLAYTPYCMATLRLAA